MDRLKALIFVIMIVLVVLSGTCLAADHDDFQARFASAFSFDLKENWGATIYEEFNFTDDASELSGQANELSVTYSGLADWFDLTGAYCQYFGKSGETWNQTNIPWIAGTIKWDMFGMDMSNKARFDYNRREGSEDGWLYKNDFTVTFPLKLTSYEIQPYLYDEVIYDFDTSRVSYNEFRSGVNSKLSEMVGLGVYYLLGHSKTVAGDWERAHMAAVQVNLSF